MPTGPAQKPAAPAAALPGSPALPKDKPPAAAEETVLKPPAERIEPIIDLDRSVEMIEQAQAQIAQHSSRWRKLKRAYNGRPQVADFHLPPEGVQVFTGYLKKEPDFPLPVVIVNGIAGDMKINRITGPNDTITAALTPVLNELRANIRLWPEAVKVAMLLGESFVNCWTSADPTTGEPQEGEIDAWVDGPELMQSIEEQGQEVCRVRVWEVPGRKAGRFDKTRVATKRHLRANVYWTTHREKWIKLGSNWLPFYEDGDVMEVASRWTADELEAMTDEALLLEGYKAEDGSADRSAAAAATVARPVADPNQADGVKKNWPNEYPPEIQVRKRIPGARLVTSLDPVPTGVHDAAIPFWLDGCRNWINYKSAMELLATPWYAEKVEVGELRDQARAAGAPRPPKTLPTPADALEPLEDESVPVRRRIGGIYKTTGDISEFAGTDGAGLKMFQDQTLLQIGRVTNYPAQDIDPSIHSSGIERREGRYRYRQMLDGMRMLIGAEIEDFVEEICILKGIALGEGQSAKVNWPEPDPLDPTEIWGASVVDGKIKAGVPARVALAEQGYDPTETEQWEAEKQQAQIDLLQGPGQGDTKLGGAPAGAEKVAADAHKASNDVNKTAKALATAKRSVPVG